MRKMEMMLAHDRSWLSYVNSGKKINKRNNKVPGRAGSETETHITLRWQGVIAQFLKVLRPQILVSVPCDGIFTCRGRARHSQKPSLLTRWQLWRKPLLFII